MEMIYEAYEYMANNCAKISFKYMDAVLTDWYSNNIKNPDDIKNRGEKLNKEAKTPASGSESASSYDIEEFEQRANQLPVYKPGKGATT